MKNNKIIAAWDEIAPCEETENRMFDIIQERLQSQKQRPAFKFKPAKILATAAAVIIIFGLINIQAVMAFIGGLFFFPGVGFTNDAGIIYYSLENPVDIETGYGKITLASASKITQNGKTNLILYFIDTNNVLLNDLEELKIIAGGKKINWSTGGGSAYFYEDFPDTNKFDLVLYGITTHIILTDQPHNFVISENDVNGILLGAYKFNGISDRVGIDVFDINSTYKKAGMFFTCNFQDICLYDKDGNEIELVGTSSSSGYLHLYDNYSAGYNMLYPKNAGEIKRIKMNAVGILYQFEKDNFIELPVPKDGETVQTDIQIPIKEFIYKISEVRREGNIIYYKDNDNTELNDMNIRNIDRRGWSASYNIKFKDFYGDPEGNSDYANAVKTAIENKESVLNSVNMSDTGIWDSENNIWTSESNIITLANGAVWLLDENAGTIKLKIESFSVIQYGDFNVEFD